MKVGIITFHHTTNYGATLQAYALSKTVSEWGHEVEIIDYRPRGAVIFYAKQLSPVSSRKMNWNKNFHKHILKAFKMRKFLTSSLNLSESKGYSKTVLRKTFEAAKYDAVIAGSDQVWCLTTGFRGFDSSYFLDFVRDEDSCLRISYAPSIGGTESFRDRKDSVCSLLDKFDHISVRDFHSARVIKEECDKEAVKVLDPTFLIGYEDILVTPKTNRPYLLIYNHKELDLEQKRTVKAIAKNKELEIVSVGDAWDIADRNLVSIDPKEWIGYFKHASYVFTNTFHGTIFSILFKRDFTVFVNKGKQNKVYDLLTLLGLERRIILDSHYGGQTDYSAIDYASAYEKLTPNIESSKAFLANIFSKENALV